MKLRLGFVGVGGIAQRHLGNAAKRCDVEIVGHADIIFERAEAAAEKFGGRAYPHCVELYDREKPDAVVICTPPYAHGEIEEEAAARGIHFFVEKPVAVNLELAARVKRAVDAAGILTQVGYMFRYAEGVGEIKPLLAKRAVAMVQQHYYMPGIPAKDWWPKFDMSGGQLIEQATHMLDLGRFLVGDVVAVSGQTARIHDWTPPAGWTRPEGGLAEFAEGLDIPDTTALILQYENGALGALSCSMAPGTRWDNGFRIVAKGLLVRIDGGNVFWSGEEEGERRVGPEWPSYVLYDFLDAVKEGRQSTRIPYDEGIRSLAISVAGYESVRRGGGWVDPRDLIRQAGIRM